MAKKTISSTNWKTDIKDWRKLNKDTADLILSQAETLLKETLDTAKSISVRAERLITIQVPLAAGLIVYVFNNLHEVDKYLPLTALLGSMVIILSIGACFNNFKNYKIQVPGEYPKIIMTSAFIDNKFNDHEQHINMVINQCENLQRRIEINDIANESRMKRNTLSLKVLIFGLISCPLLAYLLSEEVLAHCS